MTVLAAWLWQGVALTIAAALCLALFPRLNATTRHLAWWGTLAAVLALFPLQARLPISTASGAVEPPSVALSAPLSTGVLEIPAPPSWLLVMAVGLWLGTVLLALLRVARSVAHVGALKRGATPLPREIEVQLSAWTAVRGAGRPVSAGVSDQVDTPCALGLGSAVVLLPASMIDALAAEDLDRILVHEYAHLRRRDDWWRLLQALIESVAGLHPAVWWIGRRIDLEREAACDDFVVASTGACRRYAACLADVAQRRQAACRDARRPVTELAPGAVRSRSVLRRRVERLLDAGRNGSLRPARIGLASGLAALAAVVIVLGHTAPLVVFLDAAAPVTSLPLVASSPLSVAAANRLAGLPPAPVEPPEAAGADVLIPRVVTTSVPRSRAEVAPQRTSEIAAESVAAIPPPHGRGGRQGPIGAPSPEPLAATSLHAHMTTLSLHPAAATTRGGPEVKTTGAPDPWRAIASASVAVGSSTGRSSAAVGRFFARAGQAIAASF